MKHRAAIFHPGLDAVEVADIARENFKMSADVGATCSSQPQLLSCCKARKRAVAAALTRASTKCEPIKPSAPVTRTFCRFSGTVPSLVSIGIGR